MHKVTTRKLRNHGMVDIPRVCGLAQSLPFPCDYFDSIVATFPSGYVFDPNTLAEVKRVLRPPSVDDNTIGGRFIIIGLFAVYKGRTFGWIPKENLLNENLRDKWAPGWNVQITGSTNANLNLPIVIFEKQSES